MSDLQLNREELAWCAGLLEGEGCFSVNSQLSRRGDKTYYSARIRCSMTDEDVIFRLNALIPANVYERRFDLVNAKWRKQWSWELCKKQDCIDLSKVIYPFIGTRRRGQIDRILALENR